MTDAEKLTIYLIVPEDDTANYVTKKLNEGYVIVASWVVGTNVHHVLQYMKQSS